MERLAHGAPVLLHPAGLGRCNAQSVGGLPGIEAEEARGGDARRDRAERTGEMPASVMMAGRRLADPHARLEAEGVGRHQGSAVDGCDEACRGERGQDRGARVQHHPVHMRIVEVEHVTDLAVGKRGLEGPELPAAPDHRDGLAAAQSVQPREQHVDGSVPAAGQSAADPIQDAAPALVPDLVREILVARAGDERSEAPAVLCLQGSDAVLDGGCGGRHA
jgi:hypothetical protein